VKSPENMYFSCLTSRRYFIKSPAGTHAYPPVMLDFEGDRMTVHEGVPPPQNAIFLPDLVFFYKFFVSVNVFSSSK
jgi:hypothetical protein